MYVCRRETEMSKRSECIALVRFHINCRTQGNADRHSVGRIESIMWLLRNDELHIDDIQGGRFEFVAKCIGHCRWCYSIAWRLCINDTCRSFRTESELKKCATIIAFINLNTQLFIFSFSLVYQRLRPVWV